MKKERIYFHRAYKTLAGAGRGGIFAFLFLVAALDVLIGIYHVPLLHRFVEVVGGMVGACGLRVEVFHWPFLPVWIKSMPILDAAGAFPSKMLSVVSFVVWMLVVLIMPHLRRIPKVIVVYVVFLGLMNTASAAFFVFVPHLFPYDISDFSLLYMGTQFGMWLLMPVVLGVALAPLRRPVFEKWTVVVLTVVYAVVFGAVRYAAFLYLLREISVLYMAALFFALGPLIDFVYVVAIYSIYVNFIALKVRNNPETWRWLF